MAIPYSVCYSQRAPATLTVHLPLTVRLLVESEALEVIDLAAGAHVAHHDVTAVAAAVALVVVHHRRTPRRRRRRLPAFLLLFLLLAILVVAALSTTDTV